MVQQQHPGNSSSAMGGLALALMHQAQWALLQTGRA
jgi:hypothetical protein